MTDLKALRPALYLVGLCAGSLLMLNILISNGYSEHFVPPPDTTAEQFANALGAHRYEAALDLLGEDARSEVTVEDLHDLAERLESSRGGIEQAIGDGDEIQGDTATASVRVKLGDLSEETVEFSLEREDTLWKLASFDALESLAE